MEGSKKIIFSFATQSEKEAKRFLFRFEAKKNKKRKWDTLVLGNAPHMLGNGWHVLGNGPMGPICYVMSRTLYVM